MTVDIFAPSVQPDDPLLSAIAALNTAADQLIYTIGADQVALTALTSFARSLLAATNAAAVRTALELPISDQGGALDETGIRKHLFESRTIS